MDRWTALADLPLVVEDLGYGRLDPGPGFGEAHSSRLVRLTGAGHEGLGEDITRSSSRRARPGAHRRVDARLVLRAPGHGRAVAGGEPEFGDMVRRFRNWSYESAALDLALTQAGQPLHEVLGREPRPVWYVNSFGMGDPDVVPKVLSGSTLSGTALQARRTRRGPTRRWRRSRAPVPCSPSTFEGRYGSRSRTRTRSPPCTSACSRGCPTRSSRTRRPARGHGAARAARRPRRLRRADPHRRRPRRPARPGADVTSSPAAWGGCATCSRSARRARSAASRCTAAAWASSAWRAGR